MSKDEDWMTIGGINLQVEDALSMLPDSNYSLKVNFVYFYILEINKT
jgi:hypothetical protein